MSRTRRRVLTGRPNPTESEVTESQARKEYVNLLRRDRRVTGLREHKRHRAIAKHDLHVGEPVFAGKIKKYGTYYEPYWY